MAETPRAWVAYLAPGIERVVEIAVTPGATLADAVQASGIADNLPGEDLSLCKLGVWGKLRPPASALQDGDRVEIYRPLVADPKIARARRVAKKRASDRT